MSPMSDDKVAEMQAVFDHYGLQYPNGYTGNRQIPCPLGQHNDTHPSASLNLTNGVFNCFTCRQGGDALSLVMIREGVEFAKARQVIDGLAVGGGGDVRGSDDRSDSYLPSRKRHNGPRRVYRRSWRSE